jgi:hypothetical protein
MVNADRNDTINMPVSTTYRSDDFEVLRTAVEQAGAVWVGVQKGFTPDRDVVLFESKSGRALELPLSLVSTETVRAKLNFRSENEQEKK